MTLSFNFKCNCCYFERYLQINNVKEGGLVAAIDGVFSAQSCLLIYKLFKLKINESNVSYMDYYFSEKEKNGLCFSYEDINRIISCRHSHSLKENIFRELIYCKNKDNIYYFDSFMRCCNYKDKNRYIEKIKKISLDVYNIIYERFGGLGIGDETDGKLDSSIDNENNFQNSDYINNSLFFCKHRISIKNYNGKFFNDSRYEKTLNKFECQDLHEVLTKLTDMYHESPEKFSKSIDSILYGRSKTFLFEICGEGFVNNLINNDVYLILYIKIHKDKPSFFKAIRTVLGSQNSIVLEKLISYKIEGEEVSYLNEYCNIGYQYNKLDYCINSICASNSLVVINWLLVDHKDNGCYLYKLLLGYKNVDDIVNKIKKTSKINSDIVDSILRKTNMALIDGDIKIDNYDNCHYKEISGFKSMLNESLLALSFVIKKPVENFKKFEIILNQTIYNNLFSEIVNGIFIVGHKCLVKALLCYYKSLLKKYNLNYTPLKSSGNDRGVIDGLIKCLASDRSQCLDASQVCQQLVAENCDLLVGSLKEANKNRMSKRLYKSVNTQSALIDSTAVHSQETRVASLWQSASASVPADSAPLSSLHSPSASSACQSALSRCNNLDDSLEGAPDLLPGARVSSPLLSPCGVSPCAVEQSGLLEVSVKPSSSATKPSRNQKLTSRQPSNRKRKGGALCKSVNKKPALMDSSAVHSQKTPATSTWQGALASVPVSPMQPQPASMSSRSALSRPNHLSDSFGGGDLLPKALVMSPLMLPSLTPSSLTPLFLPNICTDIPDAGFTQALLGRDFQAASVVPCLSSDFLCSLASSPKHVADGFPGCEEGESFFQMLPKSAWSSPAIDPVA